MACDARAIQVGSPLAPRHIAGTYCRPAGAPARAMLVLVPGATYNRAYWDFPYRPETYSFARAAARAGYAAFALDRLGTGASSRPLGVTLTTLAQANAVHRVIGHLRGQGFDGVTFDEILLAGHSLGTGITLVEAATYHDVDGVLVTGITHKPNLTSIGVTLPLSLQPAGLDLGYLTTRPGTRRALFHDPGEVEPSVVATDEATKDVFAATELADAAAFVLLLDYSRQIDAPALLAVGEQDPLVCGPPLAGDCGTAEALLAEERPHYVAAPCLDAVVMPGVGHDLNLHPSAPAYQAALLGWVDAVVRGGCPNGG